MILVLVPSCTVSHIEEKSDLGLGFRVWGVRAELERTNERKINKSLATVDKTVDWPLD